MAEVRVQVVHHLLGVLGVQEGPHEDLALGQIVDPVAKDRRLFQVPAKGVPMGPGHHAFEKP
ncbi:hypothetical protein JCM30394_08590 [Deferrisoma palaeochoriense]